MVQSDTPLRLDLAIYGSFPSRDSDVTLLVHQCLDSGKPYFAPDGRTVTAWRICPLSGACLVDGPSPLLLPSQFPVAVAYIDATPKDCINVTACILDHIVSGNDCMRIENSTFGRDPAFGIQKQLILCATPKGARYTQVLPDLVFEGNDLSLTSFSRSACLLMTDKNRCERAARFSAATSAISAARAVEISAENAVLEEESRVREATLRNTLTSLFSRLQLHPNLHAELESLRSVKDIPNYILDAMAGACARQSVFPALPPCTETLETLRQAARAAKANRVRLEESSSTDSQVLHGWCVESISNMDQKDEVIEDTPSTTSPSVPSTFEPHKHHTSAIEQTNSELVTDSLPQTTLAPSSLVWSCAPARPIGSPPHDDLPQSIAKSFNVKKLIDRLGWAASATIFNLFPLHGINNEISNLVAGLEVKGELGSRNGVPEVIRVSFGELKPSMLFDLTK